MTDQICDCRNWTRVQSRACPSSTLLMFLWAFFLSWA